MGHGAQTPPGGGNSPGQADPARVEEEIDYGKLGDSFYPRFGKAENFSRSSTYKAVEKGAADQAKHIKGFVALDEFFLYLLVGLSTAGLTFAVTFTLIYLYSDRPGLFWYFVGLNAAIVLVVGIIAVVQWFVFRHNSIKLENYIKSDVLKGLVQEILFANERMRSPDPAQATDGLMRLLRVITDSQLQYRQIWLLWVVMKLKIDRVRKTAFYLGFIAPVLLCLLPLALRTGVEMGVGGPETEGVLSLFTVLARQFSEIADHPWGQSRLIIILASGLLAWLASVCLFWSISFQIKKVLDLKNENYYFTDIKDRLNQIFDTQFGGVVGDRHENPRYQFLPYSFDMSAFIARQFFRVNVELKRYRDRGPQGI